MKKVTTSNIMPSYFTEVQSKFLNKVVRMNQTCVHAYD